MMENYEEKAPAGWERDHDIESLSNSSAALLPEPLDRDYSNQNEHYESPRSLPWADKGLSFSNIGGKASNVTTLLRALVPSFLRSNTTPRKIHPTSWLDGLRGVAAFFVFIHHFILVWWPNLSKGYASETNTYNFFQWPFVRIIYSGRGMVTIFFVISGYVLAYGSLRKIRSREFDRLLDTLASSTFRRSMRLYIPVLAGTFIGFLVSRNGGAIAPWGGPGRRGSFIEQFKDWWWSFILITNPVQSMEGTTVFNDPYGFQLWTIPREFRGSIIVYLTLLGFAKCKQSIRLIGVTCLAHYFLYIASWDLYLFLIGMVFAEVQLAYQDWSNQSSRLSIFHQDAIQIFHPDIIPYLQKAKKVATNAFAILSLLFSIHLLCYPDQNAHATPGYLTINTYTPARYDIPNDPGFRQRYWLSIGAVLLLFTLCFSPALSFSKSIIVELQRPFTTPFAQYLGDISYALYVTHAHVIFTAGNHIKVASTKHGAGSWAYLGGFCLAIVVNTIGCFWAADLFWRAVDMKSVTWAKKFANWCWVN